MPFMLSPVRLMLGNGTGEVYVGFSGSMMEEN